MKLFRGHRPVASSATLIVLVLLVVIPFLGFLGMLTSQALTVSETVGPMIVEWTEHPANVPEYLRSLPFYDKIEPYQDQIVTKVGEIATSVGGFVVYTLSHATRGTVAFFFQLFLFLYSMFFFLMDGGKVLRKLLYYTPL